MQMLGGFSILRLSSLMSMAGLTFTKEQLLDINAKLNKIKKK
jgi:beta-galactosidase